MMLYIPQFFIPRRYHPELWKETVDILFPDSVCIYTYWSISLQVDVFFSFYCSGVKPLLELAIVFSSSHDVKIIK